MLLARGGDGGILALRQRVVLAHQALQFGEFADDFGQQIRLARCAARLAFSTSAPTSGAISAASRSIRLIRSACVPSFS